ncbi:MAG: isoprenylcysteine carboxylmethyltransferase family protein [Pseudomonadota bacterium]
MRDPARRPATLVLPPLPYALALYAAWRLDREVWPLPLQLGGANAALGWGLVGVGLGLFAWTFFAFWRHKTTVNPYVAASCLVVSGPFRFSRNPIYLGDWLVYAGATLLLGTLWPLAFAPLVWLIIRYGVIRHEERHLRARFGAEYEAFCARVGRWF